MGPLLRWMSITEEGPALSWAGTGPCYLPLSVCAQAFLICQQVCSCCSLVTQTILLNAGRCSQLTGYLLALLSLDLDPEQNRFNNSQIFVKLLYFSSTSLFFHIAVPKMLHIKCLNNQAKTQQ